MKYIVNVSIPNTLMQKRIDERRQNWKTFGSNSENTVEIGKEVFMEMVKPEQIKKKDKLVKKTKPIENNDGVYRPTIKKNKKNTAGAYDPTKLKRKTQKIVNNRDDNKLIIFNLYDECTENSLKVFLTRFASIKYINLVKNKETGRFKNCAFIETYNKDDAEYILEHCNRQPFNYLILKVKKVIPKDKRK
jgi:RNA recognition motif-containing protein